MTVFMVVHQPENGPGLVQKKNTKLKCSFSILGFKCLCLCFFVVVLSPFSRFGLNSFLTKQSAYGFKRSKFWLTQPVNLGESRTAAFHQIMEFLLGEKWPDSHAIISSDSTTKYRRTKNINKKVHRATNNDSWIDSFPAPTHFVVEKSKKNTICFHGKSSLITCPNHPRDSLQSSMEIKFLPPNLVNKSPLRFHRSPCAIHSVIIKRWTTTKWKSQSQKNHRTYVWFQLFSHGLLKVVAW